MNEWVDEWIVKVMNELVNKWMNWWMNHVWHETRERAASFLSELGVNQPNASLGAMTQEKRVKYPECTSQWCKIELLFIKYRKIGVNSSVRKRVMSMIRNLSVQRWITWLAFVWESRLTSQHQHSTSSEWWKAFSVFSSFFIQSFPFRFFYSLF